MTFKERVMKEAVEMAAQNAAACEQYARNDPGDPMAECYLGQAAWWRSRSQQEMLDAYEAFCAGAMYAVDGDEQPSWGAFNLDIPGHPVVIHVEAPALLYTVSHADETVAGRYVIQIAGYGQPDGAGSAGMMWACRLVRAKNGRPAGRTHVADDIDWAVSHCLIDFFRPPMRQPTPAAV